MIRAAHAEGVGCSLAMVIPCLYLPFSWLLVTGDVSPGYRLFWFKLWPVLPGFLPGYYLFHPHDAVEFTTMGATAFVLVVGLTWIGSYGGWRLALATGLALLVSVPTSLFSYTVFRF
jgi:hypothetical protein